MAQLHGSNDKSRRLELLFVASCTTMFALILGASLYLLVKLIV